MIVVLSFAFPDRECFGLLALLSTLVKLELGVLFVLFALAKFGEVDLFSSLLLLGSLSLCIRGFRALYQHQKQLTNDSQLQLKTLVHELRNPLFAAKGTIDILKTNAQHLTTEELGLQLTMASEALQSINQEVDDLTQLLRLESGRIISRPTRCRLKRIYENLLRRHPESSHPRHELIFLNQDVEIYCDPLLLTQAIDKLVTNALIHIEKGVVEVSGFTKFGQTFLEVRDDGPGIPKQERKWIFERHRPSAQSSGAFGIGLFLAREYVLAQDGELILLPCDKGCHFQIRLPLKKT